MRRSLSRSAAIAGLLLVPLGARAQEREAPRNLQVLDPELTRDSVVLIMRSFASALGVRCVHCHVGPPSGNLDSVDFVSDAKPAKETARLMMQMVNRINERELSALPARGTPPVRVDCITCHRASPRPLMLEDTLFTIVERQGVDSALTVYARLRERYYGRFAYDFGERSLTDLADRLSDAGRLADARAVLELNQRHYATSWNVAYELGRVYQALGERELAIAQYRKVLTILPSHPVARRRLDALTGAAAPAGSPRQ